MIKYGKETLSDTPDNVSLHTVSINLYIRE